MATKHAALRLPPDLLARIERWRDEREVGGERPAWSVAVRALIREGLDRDTRRGAR